MSNDKAQMPNKAETPDDKKKWFWHLGFDIWACLGFGAWDLGF
jgi:hypothetical protein